MADRFLENRIVAFDPAEARTANEVVSSLSGCSFQGRSLAFAAATSAEWMRGRGLKTVFLPRHRLRRFPGRWPWRPREKARVLHPRYAPP